MCSLSPEGAVPVGRRGIKEYRAAEALTLIAADRDHKPLVCPSCGSADIDRVPQRSRPDSPDTGKITLHCQACGRSAVYLAVSGGTSPEAPPEKPYRH